MLPTTIVKKLRVNLGDGHGLRMPCIIHFTEHVKFISKLRNVTAMKMKMCLHFPMAVKVIWDISPELFFSKFEITLRAVNERDFEIDKI